MTSFRPAVSTPVSQAALKSERMPSGPSEVAVDDSELLEYENVPVTPKVVELTESAAVLPPANVSPAVVARPSDFVTVTVAFAAVALYKASFASDTARAYE